MFFKFESLYNIEELKFQAYHNVGIKSLEKLDVSQCSDFSYMFYGCSSLSDIKQLDKWNVSQCTDFSCVFYKCSKIWDRKHINE